MLLARKESSLSIQDIIRACGMFDITAANVRVVVQRLVAENLLDSKERGHYQLGQAATNITKDVSTWKNALDRLDSWHGDWIGVHCAALTRYDRKTSKSKQRALKLVGCQELSKEMFIRPNNLKGGIHSMRLRLNSLGLDDEIPIFRIADFDTQTANKVKTLWDRKKIEENYQTTTDELLRWLGNLNNLSAQQAATESFLIGDRAIRQMIYDPLLPEQMINIETRATFSKTLKLFDGVGQDIWNSIIDSTPLERSFNIPKEFARHIA